MWAQSSPPPLVVLWYRVPSLCILFLCQHGFLASNATYSHIKWTKVLISVDINRAVYRLRSHPLNSVLSLRCMLTEKEKALQLMRKDFAPHWQKKSKRKNKSNIWKKCVGESRVAYIHTFIWWWWWSQTLKTKHYRWERVRKKKLKSGREESPHIHTP